jgi:hypothetical protein
MIAAQLPAAAKRARSRLRHRQRRHAGRTEGAAEEVWAEIEARPMKVDMHLHTRGSFDCLSDPHAVVERRCSCGSTASASRTTTRSTPRSAQRTYPEHVIVGEEVKTAERVDIIGLFLTERIPKGTPARETCERIRAQGGIVYVPHPFAGGKGGGGGSWIQIEDLVDAVEGFNARIHDPALNERAVGVGASAEAARSAPGPMRTRCVRSAAAGSTCRPFEDARALLGRAACGHGRTAHLSSRAGSPASTWAKVTNAWDRCVMNRAGAAAYCSGRAARDGSSSAD